MNVALSEKDRKFREFALEGSMWKVIWKVCYPLAIYQSLNQLFKILDTMMAAHISANAVSTVAYLSQINMAISALGGGLAVGASIKISEAYGEGNFELVKRRVSTLFALCGLLGMAILAILIPVAPQFLRLANTPEEFIEEGTVYFILELVSLVIIFFNNVYIAIERARGNSKRILNLNMMVIGIKLSLTAFFVYVLKGGINYISIATIVSQLTLFGAAVFYMNAKENVFGFSWKAISFRKLVVAPMIKLSVPVIVEKMAFSLGKVVVNSMSTVYGTLTVGALGISNNIGGITTNPQNGFQEGASAIISQNLGAGKYERIRKGILTSILMGWVWCVLCIITSYTVVPTFVKMLISSDNRKVIDTATLYLRVDSLLYFVTAMITIIRNSLQGIGDRLTPIISSGIELAGKVVITFTLVPFMGYWGVIVSEPIVWVLMVIPLIVQLIKNPAFARGKNK